MVVRRRPDQDAKGVRETGYALPGGYEWCDCDISSAEGAQEVYTLLSENYVEDDDNMFRFNYSSHFLSWALQPPGFKPFWHVGVRVIKSKKLVAFISAIPAKIRVGKNSPKVSGAPTTTTLYAAIVTLFGLSL